MMLPLASQIKAWRQASRRMRWKIPKAAFAAIGSPPEFGERDRKDGFSGVMLCYGFGNDGSGQADPIESAGRAWAYAIKTRKKRTWWCQYIEFDTAEHVRLRPGAPARPRGFYFASFNPGAGYRRWTVTQVRRSLENDTGCAFEGLQLLAITHPHFLEQMNQRQMPFMALADFDVAPYGYGDFYDAPQLFCSNDIFGLGIGHVDRVYPLFAIPVLRF